MSLNASIRSLDQLFFIDKMFSLLYICNYLKIFLEFFFFKFFFGKSYKVLYSPFLLMIFIYLIIYFQIKKKKQQTQSNPTKPWSQSMRGGYIQSRAWPKQYLVGFQHYNKNKNKKFGGEERRNKLDGSPSTMQDKYILSQGLKTNHGWTALSLKTICF